MTALLIHGSLSNNRLWTPIVQALGLEARTPNLVGALGDAPAPGAGLHDDVQRMTAELFAFDGPALLIGHSYGALVALKVAQSWPQRVRAVIAHDPVAWTFLAQTREGLAPYFSDAELHGFLDPDVGGSPEWVQRFVDFWNGPGTFDRLPEHRRAAMLSGGPKTFAEVSAVFYDDTPMTEWAKVQVPIRATLGQQSPKGERAAVHAMQAVFPDFQITDVPGGHLALATHPQVVEVWRPWVAAFSPRADR